MTRYSRSLHKRQRRSVQPRIPTQQIRTGSEVPEHTCHCIRERRVRHRPSWPFQDRRGQMAAAQDPAYGGNFSPRSKSILICEGLLASPIPRFHHGGRTCICLSPSQDSPMVSSRNSPRLSPARWSRNGLTDYQGYRPPHRCRA